MEKAIMSNRTTFKKSHTCGSLFANCNCSTRSSNEPEPKPIKFNQSYSHPDTSYIFTDENKVPSYTRSSTYNKTRHGNGNATTVSDTKRLSSPNIGDYSILDVDVHPEVVLTVSHTNGEIQPLYADTKRDKATLQCKKSLSVIRSELAKTSSDQSLNKYKISREEDTKDDSKNENMEYLSVDSVNRRKISNDEFRNSSNNKSLDSATDLNSKSRNDLESVSNSSSTSSLIGIHFLNHKIRKSSRSLSRHVSDCTAPQFVYDSPISETKRSNSMFLEDEVLRLKDTIKERDNEIIKLKREIHKLKSVLQQTTLNLNQHKDMNGIPLYNSETCSVGAINCLNDRNCNHILIPKLHKISQCDQLTVPSLAVKRQGVSGESTDTSGQLSRDIRIPKYDKDFRSKQLIKEALIDNDFLKNIDSTQTREVVDSMYSRKVENGEYVIREGEVGAHLYVSAEGEFEVIKEGKVLGKMGPGKAFGELAILYNCTRTATIKALCDSVVWTLDRRAFQQIMMKTGMQRIEENVNFLRSVPLLKNLSNNLLAKIADELEVEFYPAGAYVIRQGANGDTFYLISNGTVKVTQKLAGSKTDEDEIRTLTRGDYFGEQALIKEDKRTANVIAMAPGVECLTLDRESFNLLIGDLCELHEKDYGDEIRVLAMKRSESTNVLKIHGEKNQELLDIPIEKLEIVATLGLGGFGRVELVKYEKDMQETQTYALKCLKKQHIVELHQEEHVINEKLIMLSCESAFICRLFRTYRDSKYVYMLLEACMGGEVWTLLRNRGYFDDSTTNFIVGCVLMAFDYLHTRGIVYRDLKPENLMVDSKGYVKLVDFGFAKYIGQTSKTWTFCGTPEYVAPEIVLNKGHDRAVDYWSLGILIHELLTGTPPFTSTEPMKIYNIILKGIDMVDFPRHMSRSAIILIKRLCRDVPSERLGYQRGGLDQIKNHRWFQGFDWEKLENLTLSPPFSQTVNGPLDVSNFDYFPKENEDTPDETSNWDKDF